MNDIDIDLFDVGLALVITGVLMLVLIAVFDPKPRANPAPACVVKPRVML